MAFMQWQPAAQESSLTHSRFNKVVSYGGFLYLSGQTAADNATASFREQVAVVLGRIEQLLVMAGSDKRHLLSAVMLVQSEDNIGLLHQLWEHWLDEGATPITHVAIASMVVPGSKVEISVVAVLCNTTA